MKLKFDGPYHPSHLKAMDFCQRKAKYEIVMGIKPNYRSLKAISGTAIHSCIQNWHLSSSIEIDKSEEASELFRSELLKEIYEPTRPEERDIPIWWEEDETADIDRVVPEFGQMFYLYTHHLFAHDEFEVLADECVFHFEIDKYAFEGRIDQVRRYTDSGRIVNVDFKSGVMDATIGQFCLGMNVQYLTYAMAIYLGSVKESKFDTKGIVPDIVQFNLRDLIPYAHTPTGKERKWKREISRDMTDSYKSWANDVCDEREYYGDGNISHGVFLSGQPKGPGAHWAFPSEQQLITFKDQLKRYIQPFRWGRYNPSYGTITCTKCRFKELCRDESEGIIHV